MNKEFKTSDEWKEIFRKSERQFNILLVVTICLIVIAVTLRIIVIKQQHEKDKIINIRH